MWLQHDVIFERFVTKKSATTTITLFPLFTSALSSSPWNHRHYHQLSSSVLCRSSTAVVMSTVPMFDPIVIDGRVSELHLCKQHLSSSNAFMTGKASACKIRATLQFFMYLFYFHPRTKTLSRQKSVTHAIDSNF
jgi:hypothetical protein